MTNNPTRSTSTFPDYRTVDLSAWGFTPGSRIDKHGVLYSKDRTKLLDGRKAKEVYEIATTVTKIAKEAFLGADIEELIIPPGVDNIPQAMCKGCKRLHQVVIPGGITRINGGAFWGCKSLAQIDIPASVMSIGRYAFFSCRKLTDVIVPEGCAIEEGAFPKTCRAMTLEEARLFRAQQAMDKYADQDVETVGMARQGNP